MKRIVNFIKKLDDGGNITKFCKKELKKDKQE